MLRQAIRLFHQFRGRQLTLRMNPFPLNDPNGQRLGYVDRTEIRGGNLLVEGWACAKNVELQMDCGQSRARERHVRTDAIELGFEAAKSFTLSHTFSNGAKIALIDDHQGVFFAIRKPRKIEVIRAEIVVVVQFVKACVKARRLIMGWVRLPTAKLRSALRAAFTLDTQVDLPSVDRQILRASIPAPDAGAYTILLPVYNAAPVLQETLRRISEYSQGNWTAIVVDDASSDRQIALILADWSATNSGRVRILRNTNNVGFVKSVNRGLEELRGSDRPVVLLNSDAWVPQGWDQRLLEPLSDPLVASVTPMSNDAELSSVPVKGRKVRLKPGQGDAIDRCARFLGGTQFAQTPTGVGFCMAISPRWLAQVPALDTIFGRGYGEEVDWCQRIRSLGGRHVIQHRLFVEHAGAESFGAKERAALVAKASTIISGRYPRFDQDVQNFLADDPIVTARMSLAIAWAGSAGQPVSIFLAHSMGGGAEIALQREICDEVRLVGAAIVLRVGGKKRWCLEVHSDVGRNLIATNRLGIIERLLDPIKERRVIYSCGVGDFDPIELPDILLRLGHRGRIELRVHDYFCLSPSVFLLNDSGHFAGVPPICDRSESNSILRPDGRIVYLAEWRKAWGRLVDVVDEVRVFSESSAQIFGTAFPNSASVMTQVPHALQSMPNSVGQIVQASRPTVGILGNLGAEKGAGVVCELARMFGSQDDVRFVALGQVDPSFSPPPRLKIHGGYRIDDIPKLMRRYGISGWLMPSICPETFSFVTHEALATGLPVIGIDIGAQGDALKAHENGSAVPVGSTGPDLMRIFQTINEVVSFRTDQEFLDVA